jgi:hypothetical protein
MIPVDVWNVHNIILREVLGEYGAEVPPGVDALRGETYTWEDADDVRIFKQHIRDFRQWMKDNGERDKPLIVSEFSVLYGEDFGFDSTRVRGYLHATFEYLRWAADASLGYPGDGDRLVQRWAWYSLDDDNFEGLPSNHHLFDPETKEMTGLGRDYASYPRGLNYLPTIFLGYRIDLVMPPVTTHDVGIPQGSEIH